MSPVQHLQNYKKNRLFAKNLSAHKIIWKMEKLVFGIKTALTLHPDQN
jgi:hypothetical protein